MIRLLILIMAGAAALAITYFFFKSIPLAQKMLAVGGGLFAALLATALQTGYPIYTAFLALIGVSLLASLVYMKILEKQQLEKQRMAEERKRRLTMASPSPQQNSSNTIHENTVNKSFGMEPIELGKGERKLG